VRDRVTPICVAPQRPCETRPEKMGPLREE
jgi:hypothetical protein